MSYGENIQHARNAIARTLIERPTSAFTSADFDARNLLVTGLSELSTQIVGPADRDPGKAATFERGLISRPTVALNRQLAATAGALPSPDPSEIMKTPDSSDLRTAAKYIALAGADLSVDKGWHAKANQQWVVAKDIADMARGVALVDAHRVDPEVNPLPSRDRLLVTASAASQVARGGKLDYGVDAVAVAEPVRMPAANYSPAFLEAFHLQQVVADDLSQIPSLRNLRQVLRHQAQLSARLSEQLGGPLDSAVSRHHAERHIQCLQAFRQLRTLNGNVGRGLDAAVASSNAATVIRFAPPGPLDAADRNLIAAFTSLSDQVDSNLADAIQAGLVKGLYNVRGEVARPSEFEVYEPNWVPAGRVQRDLNSEPQFEWVKASHPESLEIWRTADRFRRLAATTADMRSRRGLADRLDQLLTRSGSGPRPERPHSR